MFFIYIDLLNYNQLNRLNPEYAEDLKDKTEKIVEELNGLNVDPGQMIYQFPLVFEESTAKFVDAVFNELAHGLENVRLRPRDDGNGVPLVADAKLALFE